MTYTADMGLVLGLAKLRGDSRRLEVLCDGAKYIPRRFRRGGGRYPRVAASRTGDALFHPKIWLFHRRGRVHALAIGSMNLGAAEMSQAANFAAFIKPRNLRLGDLGVAVSQRKNESKKLKLLLNCRMKDGKLHAGPHDELYSVLERALAGLGQEEYDIIIASAQPVSSTLLRRLVKRDRAKSCSIFIRDPSCVPMNDAAVPTSYLTPRLLSGSKKQLHGKAFFAGNSSRAVLYIGSANFTATGYGLSRGASGAANIEGGVLISAEGKREVQYLRTAVRRILSGEWGKLKPEEVKRGRSLEDRSQGEDREVRLLRHLAASISIRRRSDGANELRLKTRLQFEAGVLDLHRLAIQAGDHISDAWERGRTRVPREVSLTLPAWSVDLHLHANYDGLRSTLVLPLSHLMWDGEGNNQESRSIFELLAFGDEAGSRGSSRRGKDRLLSGSGIQEEDDLRFPWATLRAVKKLVRGNRAWGIQAHRDVSRRLATATQERQRRKWSIVLEVMEALNGHF